MTAGKRCCSIQVSLFPTGSSDSNCPIVLLCLTQLEKKKKVKFPKMSYPLEKQKKEKRTISSTNYYLLNSAKAASYVAQLKKLEKIPDVYAVFNYMVTPVASLTQLCQYWGKVGRSIFWQ